MRLIKVILVSSLLVFLLGGCSGKKELVIQTEYKEVKVPVKPKRPEIDCKLKESENDDPFKTIELLVECVSKLKNTIIELTVP